MARITSITSNKSGKVISLGDVLRHQSDGTSGVVVELGIPGQLSRFPGMAVGDIAIQTSRQNTRITNCYDEWSPVPHDDQTYEQRYVSWLLRPFEPWGEEYGHSRDCTIALDGIMALLPTSITGHQDFYPRDIEDVISRLAEHLETLRKFAYQRPT